jgi:hypothetical protein
VEEFFQCRAKRRAIEVLYILKQGKILLLPLYVCSDVLKIPATCVLFLVIQA